MDLVAGVPPKPFDLVVAEFPIRAPDLGVLLLPLSSGTSNKFPEGDFRIPPDEGDFNSFPAEGDFARWLMILMSDQYSKRKIGQKAANIEKCYEYYEKLVFEPVH